MTGRWALQRTPSFFFTTEKRVAVATLLAMFSVSALGKKLYEACKKSPPHPGPLPPGEGEDNAEAGYQGILELRRLHRELDRAICQAYGWQDLLTGAGHARDEEPPNQASLGHGPHPPQAASVTAHSDGLNHDFHAVETLPENDRVRHTISPAARKEILKRLLAENHRRAAAQNTEPQAPAKAGKRGRKAKNDERQDDLAQHSQTPG